MKHISWIIRCTGAHLLVYIALALPMGLLTGKLPEAETASIRFFEMFLIPHAGHLAGQLLRGIVIALVLYPFYTMIFTHPKGRTALFWALWGLSMIGSVEPLPGSIEGWIYTITSPLEHGIVLFASLVQALALTALLARVEARFGSGLSDPGDTTLPPLQPTPRGVFRFSLLHIVTYLTAGLIFMIMQDYGEAFAASRFFQMYRPLDGPIVGTFAVPMQIPRGILLGLWMAPFIAFALPRRRGWLLVFLAIFGLTALATPGYMPLIFTHIAEGGSLFNYIWVGTPEIFVQMLIFSAALLWWERRNREKKLSGAFPTAGKSKTLR